MKAYGNSFNIKYFACALLLAAPLHLWAAPPANDNFADRITLSGVPVSGTSTTVEATIEGGENTLNEYTYETVWWTWTAPSAGIVRMDAAGSGISDPRIAVYNGTSLGALTGVAATIADNTGSNFISFPTVAGTVYQISVGSNGTTDEGTVKLNISLSPTNITSPVVVGSLAAANDNFANRATLTGPAVSGIGYDFSATHESLEPSGTGYQTLWWTWTAPANGTLVVDSALTSYGNVVAAFTGTSVGNLTVIDYAKQQESFDPPASFSIGVTKGTSYQFSIGATDSGGGGTAVLDLNFSTRPAFFIGEAALANGVYYLQFPNGDYFGYYSFLSDPNYIYHFDLGYEYVFDAADGHGGVYLYDFASKTFFYTSPGFPFPYLYDFTLNAVLYYYPKNGSAGHYTTNPRYFFNFATGKIITK